MSFAVVRRIVAIEPHPDPERTRIEVIELDDGTKLVTGKHYRAGLLGIHLKPGCLIPGWLAEQLWLVGKKRAKEWFEVRSITIVGVESPGLFCGAEYLKDASIESEWRYRDLESQGGRQLEEGWITWPAWRESWHPGIELDAYLGVVPVPEVIIAKPFGETKHQTFTVIGTAASLPSANAANAGDETRDWHPLDVTGAASSLHHEHPYSGHATTGQPPTNIPSED